MKTLALSNGDLVVGQEGHVTVTGVAKVRQGLALALGEYFGSDRFHPTDWGSTVTDYLGLPIDETIEFEVRAEVSRVLAQYIAIQDREIYSDYIAGRRSRYAAGDVIRSVTDITTRVNFSEILISVSLVTLSGSQVTLNRTVDL